MIQTLETLKNVKVKLSVPLIASYLDKGYTQANIARICNVSYQAVSDYIKRHYDELAPLVDTTDGILAMRSKHLANKAQEKIEGILEVDNFNKRERVWVDERYEGNRRIEGHYEERLVPSGHWQEYEEKTDIKAKF